MKKIKKKLCKSVNISPKYEFYEHPKRSINHGYGCSLIYRLKSIISIHYVKLKIEDKIVSACFMTLFLHVCRSPRIDPSKVVSKTAQLIKICVCYSFKWYFWGNYSRLA